LSPTKRPTPNSQGERSRTAIIGAAAALFADAGYRGTSLATIAAAVGMTQPGLLHHFPSKEDLLLAVLEQHYNEDSRVVDHGLQTGGLELFDALDDLVARNAAAPAHVRLLAVLVAEALTESHPAHDHFVARYRRVRSTLQQTLRDEQRRGEISADTDVDNLALLIVSVMDGLQLQWMLDPDVDMLSSFRSFVAIIQRAVRT
jgi:AcrR family transcriptional regulator